MTERYEWKVPESWIRAAVNLYLGTITTPPGDHRCEQETRARKKIGENQMTLDQLIKRIKELDAKATREFKPVCSQHCGHLRNEANYQINYKDEWPETDKAFISAARTLLPACAIIITDLRAGLTDLIHAVETDGGLVSYRSDVLDRAKARIESVNAELSKLAISDETRTE